MSREEFCAANDIDPRRKLVGILPGSRTREIKSLLPEFLKAAEKFNEISPEPPIFLIPQAPTIEAEELFGSGLSDFDSQLEARIIGDNRYDLMAACDAIVAASGTVTLEILLLDTPMVVAYKLSPMTYRVGRLLVRLGQFSLVNLGFFSLVNLVAGKGVVVELLQDEANAEAISAELYRLIFDPDHRSTQMSEFKGVREKLGDRGASKHAAALAISIMEKND